MFIAGQWTEMGLPKAQPDEHGPQGEEFVKDGVVRRAYSIASPPEQPELVFFFNRVEQGQLTPFLAELKEGDRLYVDPEARGHFTLEGISSDKNLIFAATGTGIAPFASIIAALARQERWRRVVILHGARSAQLLGFMELFREAQEHDLSVLYIPVLSRPDDGWGGERGYVQELLRDREEFEEKTGIPLDPAETHVFLCGHNGMIQEAENLLMPHGFEPRWSNPQGTIHTEIYY